MNLPDVSHLITTIAAASNLFILTSW